MKESNPTEVDEYFTANKLQKEPSFAWWITYTLKKHSWIGSTVSQRIKIKREKYGICIPKIILRVYDIDKENNNTRWRDDINKKS